MSERRRVKARTTGLLAGRRPVSEPILLSQLRQEEKDFLSRHPYLDSDALSVIRLAADECPAFRGRTLHHNLDRVYEHVQNCSRCVTKLENHRRKAELVIA